MTSEPSKTTGRARARNPNTRYLQIEFKWITTDEIRELIGYYSRIHRGVYAEIKHGIERENKDIGTDPHLIGKLKKEYYYRMAHGGSTVAEMYPDIFTEKGPKNIKTLRKQDRRLMSKFEHYLKNKDKPKNKIRSKKPILTDSRKPRINKNGTYHDTTGTRLSNGLTMREEKYCIEYIATADPLEAWIRSGYDISYEGWERHAVTWREIPKIKARIIELIDEAKEKMTWDAEKVLNRFDEIYQKALDEQDFTNATRSMENIAKHLGMYVERSEQRIGSLDGMKTEDIDKDISKLANVVGLKVVNGGKSE